jgi:DNA-binding transcriptional ArsR family regulator
LVHRQSKRSDLVGGSAGFLVGDKPMVRLQVGGKTRRIALARAAWIVHHGEYPNGSVQPCDGDHWNASPANLTLVPSCSHRPQSAAGKASSLIRRQEADRALLAALAAHSGACIAQLARITSTSESRVSTHLGKLAVQGLATSPMCVPGRAWMLTDQGRLAAAGRPLIDDLDRQVPAVLRVAPMGHVRLSRRIGVCLLTARRRANLLAERGLVFPDVRKFYSITPEGIEALGPKSQPPPRWVNVAAISAAAAKDIAERTRLDDRTQEERSRPGRMARVAAKRNRSTPFNGGGFFERGMAEAS